jgi:hypothetical protein
MQTNTRIQEKSQGNTLYNEFSSRQNNTLKEGIRSNEYFVNIDGVDYILISADTFRLGKHQWDDLRVSAETTELVGSNAPDYRQFKNTETEFTGFALRQTDASQDTSSVLTGAQVGFGSDLSVSMWIEGETFSGTQGLLEFGSFFIEWRFSDNIRVGGYGGNNVNGAVVDGQKTFIVFTLENTAGNDWTATLYMNGTLVDSDSFTNASMPTYAADTITLFPDNYRGRLDSLAFFDAALTNADVITYYNGGNGTPIVGTENNLTYGWNFDEGTGTSAAEVNEEAVPFLGIADWGDGLVESSSSTGVLLKAFSPDVEQEVFFSVQFPHAWKEGSAIRPHVHWTPFSDAGEGESVVWGLEYTWANVLSDFNDTTIVYTSGVIADTDITADNHLISQFPEIDATGKSISSMMLCRLFRAVDETADNFDDDAGLLEFDIHYQIDSTGSDEEYVK